MHHITHIGFVNSPVTDPVDEDWGSVVAKIRLDDTFSSGLTGLENFSHAVIVFFMHDTSFDASADIISRPRGRDDMPLTGIFAQRARHRPFPIGVTAVEIVGVEGDTLRVRGLDAINGTPVIDIKPYFRQFDRVEAPKAPEWVDELMKEYF